MGVEYSAGGPWEVFGWLFLEILEHNLQLLSSSGSPPLNLVYSLSFLSDFLILYSVGPAVPTSSLHVVQLLLSRQPQLDYFLLLLAVSKSVILVAEKPVVIELFVEEVLAVLPLCLDLQSPLTN